MQPGWRLEEAARAYGEWSPGPFTAHAKPALAVNPALVTAYATLWLRPGAPLRLVKSAYRTLAAQHHPDAGGDTHMMRRLNEAYQTLRAALDQ